MEQAIAGGILLAIFYLAVTWMALVTIWALRWVILGVLLWTALGLYTTHLGWWVWGDYVLWSFIGPGLVFAGIGLVAKFCDWLVCAYRFFSKKIATPAIASSPAPGQRVFHARFGNGKVLRVEGDKLTIAFDRAGEKKVGDAFVEVVVAP
jgi:hypothetical protein